MSICPRDTFFLQRKIVGNMTLAPPFLSGFTLRAMQIPCERDETRQLKDGSPLQKQFALSSEDHT